MIWSDLVVEVYGVITVAVGMFSGLLFSIAYSGSASFKRDSVANYGTHDRVRRY
jgi:hypothetical protein